MTKFCIFSTVKEYKIQLFNKLFSYPQNTENQDEEMIGNLRSAAGKARLLVSQKIQQFEGIYSIDILFLLVFRFNLKIFQDYVTIV